MFIAVDEELKKICAEILQAKKTETEWAEIESDDFFQTAHYVGGFDGTEMAFCFSYFDDNRQEYWFQFFLEDTEKIVNGEITQIEARKTQT